MWSFSGLSLVWCLFQVGARKTCLTVGLLDAKDMIQLDLNGVKPNQQTQLGPPGVWFEPTVHCPKTSQRLENGSSLAEQSSADHRTGLFWLRHVPPWCLCKAPCKSPWPNPSQSFGRAESCGAPHASKKFCLFQTVDFKTTHVSFVT